MKVNVIRTTDEPRNVQIIRDLLEAIPDEDCATLDLIDETPHLVIRRMKNGMTDEVSLPLVPKWLNEPELAGKLAIAAATFVVCLYGTEKGGQGSCASGPTSEY
jgi:hypothetical protein